MRETPTPPWINLTPDLHSGEAGVYFFKKLIWKILLQVKPANRESFCSCSFREFLQTSKKIQNLGMSQDMETEARVGIAPDLSQYLAHTQRA